MTTYIQNSVSASVSPPPRASLSNRGAAHRKLIVGMRQLHPLVDEWVLWQLSARRAPKTVMERARVIQQFLDEIELGPVEVQHMDVILWTTSHPEWSASTASTYHAYLVSWHKWLCLMDYRADNPMRKLVSPRRPDRAPRPVADDGLVKLLTMRMHHRTRVMVLLGSLAGLRVSEIAKVKGEDLDLASERMYVIGKGGKRAWVPVHPLIMDAANTMPTRGWWFPGNNRRPGEHMHPKSVSDILGQAMRRAGVVGTPHSLRHWYASTLLDTGADLRTVQELLRHSSVQTTQVYTKVPDARRLGAVNQLNPFGAQLPPPTPAPGPAPTHCDCCNCTATEPQLPLWPDHPGAGSTVVPPL